MTVQIREDGVHKVHTSAAIARVEALRTEAAARLGPTAGFRVPRVLRVDGPELVFERLDGLVMLHDHLARNRGDGETAARVGRVLAAIHAGLALPEGLERRVTAVGGYPEVPLHGDFSDRNVQLDPDGALVLLDWSAQMWMDPLATHGPPTVDLASMVLSLYGDPLLSRRRVRRVEDRARAFLAGYVEASGRPGVVPALATTLGPMIRRLLPYLFKQKRPQSVLTWPSMVRVWRFARRLERGGL